jgi:hypothetical protein
MSDSDSHGKFRVGQLYYELSTTHGSPRIETWQYVGYKESRTCNSSSCDVPYFFHHFVRCYCGEGNEEHGIRVPSLAQAERTFLAWDEFCSAIAKLRATSASEAPGPGLVPA